MNLDLENKTALVTGSHRGTGQIIAQTLLSEGAQVLVHGMTMSQAQASVEELGGGIAVSWRHCQSKRLPRITASLRRLSGKHLDQ